MDGPRGSHSSDNLLHAYHNYTLPRIIGPPQLDESLEDVLDSQSATFVRSHFRKFAKTAARSAVLLSQEEISIADIRSAFLSLSEGLDRLRGVMGQLPCDDKNWIGSPSSARLPPLDIISSLVDYRSSPALSHLPNIPVPLTPLGITPSLVDYQSSPISASQGSSLNCSDLPTIPGYNRYSEWLDDEATLSTYPEDALPVFPLTVCHLPVSTDTLIVPTSDPLELEYPYMYQLSADDNPLIVPLSCVEELDLRYRWEPSLEQKFHNS
ncbi:hypothetical protein C8T65DRAFT_696249 [Cerioporus squamosus]|nr:hypothetical protein C8T65DRAFT_696249 [Cerioporus squamosus]